MPCIYYIILVFECIFNIYMHVYVCIYIHVYTKQQAWLTMCDGKQKAQLVQNEEDTLDAEGSGLVDSGGDLTMERQCIEIFLKKILMKMYCKIMNTYLNRCVYKPGKAGPHSDNPCNDRQANI